MIDRETDGNPFFVEEVYLHLVESGVLLDDMAGYVLTFASTRVGAGKHPARARSTAGPFGCLHPRRARCAAVSGRAFASDLVGDVAGLTAVLLRPSMRPSEPARCAW